MTDYTTMSKVSWVEVISTGARRRWTPEEKRRIVSESYGGRREVSATARRVIVGRPEPLEERKGKLQLLRTVAGGIQLNEHIAGDGATIFQHACRLGFEGIVSKHREHPVPLPYEQGLAQDQ